MRILVSTTANVGHFEPLLGIARACRDAGHEVRVAAPRSFEATVARTDFPFHPFDDAPPELIGPVMSRLPELSFEEANATVVREVFGRIDAQAALPALAAAVEAWRPDVIVREPAELGSLAVAERAGIPQVQVAIGMAEMVRLFAEQLVEPLTDLATMAGLPDDSLNRALAGVPTLSSVPEVLDRAGDVAFSDDAVTYRFREDPPAPAATPLPQWGDPGLPLVYVTFGSVTGSLPPFAGVFRQALDGLADLSVRVLMTVGRQVSITDLGPVPANARVEPWWPQTDVLAEAALVLGHGGYGTTMGAITAGVPQVVAPIFTTDQAVNARHIAAVGAGRAVSPGPDVVVRACQEVQSVLEDPSYRHRAAVVAAAIAALPSTADTVAVIRRIAGITTSRVRAGIPARPHAQ